MMRLKHIKLLLVLIVAVFYHSETAQAQRYWDDDDHPLSLNMPQISLITVMPNNSAITLSLGIPSSPGARPPDNVPEARDSSKWLNYTCAIRGRRQRRRVDVQVTQGSIPQGLKISVEAESIQPHGRGTRGNPSGIVWLSSSSQTLVTNIGNCHTGRGAQRGHRLIYKLKLDDFNTLDAEPRTAITVTYTISDL